MTGGKKSGLGERTRKALGDDQAVDKSTRMRTTLYLNEKNYKRFQRLCKKRGRTTSEIVDDMIADALDEFEK